MDHQQMPLPPPHSHYGTVGMEGADGGSRMSRRSVSPPPPPLPMIDDQDAMGGVGGVRRRVVPADADLPGWVPKDFIDKGLFFIYIFI